jgi:hypothetical protein
MIHILIVARDPRARQLIGPIERTVSTSVVVTDSLDEGIKEFFRLRPSVVLIEKDLDGTDSGSFSGYVKAMFPDKSPRIILLTVSPSASSPQGVYDTVIDLTRPPSDTIPALLEYLNALSEERSSRNEESKMAGGLDGDSEDRAPDVPFRYLVGIPAKRQGK